jgi:methyl-accepting chemotaxis protein
VHKGDNLLINPMACTQDQASTTGSTPWIALQATQQTVAAIQKIARTITEMSQTSTSIAAAIEEQGTATAEIARSVQEAARGTEVHKNVDSG